MGEPDVVPDRLTNPLNRPIIGVIVVIGLVLYFVFNSITDEELFPIVFGVSVILPATVAFFSFLTAKQYYPGILSKAYLSLGLGFVCYLIAEILYYTLEFFGIEPYPSIADVFFFALYPFTLGHLLFNIKFFHSKFTVFQKIWLPLIPIIAVSAYVILSFNIPDAEFSFDFYYGFIFVIAASIVLSFTVLGASIFKQGVLGAVWLLLVVGLMLNTVGDIWYYNLEIFGAYYDAHPVTILWDVSNMFMIYALYKHRKTL